MKELALIGRAERVDLPQLSAIKVPAKIDTGADGSSIWAHSIKKEAGCLRVIFFGPESKHYTGEVHEFSPNKFSITRVSNSFGHREVRYKVKLKIAIKGKLINGTFTLADRSSKLYPILIGRSLLRHKFLVDVTKGSPLLIEEKARKDALEEEIIKLSKET
jgi:hypothetical protein